MEGILSKLQKNTKLSHIYIANIILSIHYFLIIYINSSSLERFFSERTVSMLYIAGSILGLTLFLTASKLTATYGVYRYLFTVTALECAVTLGMAQFVSPLLIAWFFILHCALVPMILYSLDVYLEHATKKESSTGLIRGSYLTVTNIILVLSPLITGFILKHFSFENVYFLSVLMILPLFVVIEMYLRNDEPKTASHITLSHGLRTLKHNKDLRYSIIAQFILQLFYAWVVIYLPLYLISEIGFAWDTLGKLFTIMLLPFLLFELPIGWIADHKYGEKEFMIFGFIATALAMSLLTIPFPTHFLTWAMLLFFSRFGASFVEVTNESYFFKHVSSNDGDVISIFRMMRPIAYIVTPLIATASLAIFPFSTTFWILACITLLGSIAAFNITDTK